MAKTKKLNPRDYKIDDTENKPGQKDEEQSVSPTAKKKTNLLESRITLGLESKKNTRENISIYHVDPAKVKIRDDHDRNYELLDEGNCSDLIEGFKLTGQITPAVVMEIQDDDDYDWELICGARRHWSAAFLNKPLAVEPRVLSEQQVFLLTDQENRSRKDISDHERAVKYLKANEEFYNNITKMAANIGMSKSMLAYLVGFAKAPYDLIRVIENIEDFKERQYRELKPQLFESDNTTIKDAALKFLSALPDRGINLEDLIVGINDLTATPKKRVQVDKYVIREPITDKEVVIIKHNPKRGGIDIQIKSDARMDEEKLMTYMHDAWSHIQDHFKIK